MNNQQKKQVYNNILFVDLDGSLISSDTLWECLLFIFRTNFAKAIILPFWLLFGRAVFKLKVTESVNLDASELPYRLSVLTFIKRRKSEGQKIILATAANEKIANLVASHLGIFDDILSSSSKCNLKGLEKLKAILKYSNGEPFDYIGDSRSDLLIWEKSSNAIGVAPSCSVSAVFAQKENWTILEQRPKINLIGALKVLRAHQWAKNILLFVPIVLAHKIGNPSIFFSVFLAFLAFSLCASATYLWNDLFDLPEDRKHPVKKNRPLASGILSIPASFAISLVLLLISAAISLLFLPLNFSLMLVGYILLTVSYTFYFKKKLMVDVLILSGLYTYRIIAGGISVGITVTPWLLVFSIFFFLSLAFVKRYTELITTDLEFNDKLGNRGYYPNDRHMISSFGTSSGYVSVLVFALYLNSPGVTELYSTPEYLWLIGPCLIYWLSRIWFLAHREQMNEDPVLFSVRDKNSIGIGVVIAILLLLAAT